MAVSKQSDGGPAFPCPVNYGLAPSPGMSLRAWLAGQALAGLSSDTSYTVDRIPYLAVKLADDTLRELERPAGGEGG